MADAKSTTNNNVPATNPEAQAPQGEDKKPEQLTLFTSLGLMAKGAYIAPAVTASVVATAANNFFNHKDDFEEKTEQALDMFFNGLETTLDTMEAAQVIARKNLYGVKDVKELDNMSRADRVAKLVAKFESEE